MVDEFSLPSEIIDRKVTKMKMISPSNREVDVGRTLSDKEYIGMCRREILDSYLRKRATDLGTKVINGLVMRLEQVGPPAPRGGDRPDLGIHQLRCHFCDDCQAQDRRWWSSGVVVAMPMASMPLHHWRSSELIPKIGEWGHLLRPPPFPGPPSFNSPLPLHKMLPSCSVNFSDTSCQVEQPCKPSKFLLRNLGPPPPPPPAKRSLYVVGFWQTQKTAFFSSSHLLPQVCII